MKRLLCLVVLLAPLVLSGCSEDDNAVTKPESSVTLTGQLFGTMTVERDSLPPDVFPDSVITLDQWYRIGPSQTIVRLLEDGTRYEFRRTFPAESLSVEIGGKALEIATDGAFSVADVPVGRQEVVWRIAGQEITRYAIDVTESSRSLALDCQLQRCRDSAHVHKLGPLTISCLDNNGVGPGGFIFSDCWTSLFYGPPWYSWMCWQEAMNAIHDHHGNIWCDGSHNCSLFVHCWNWNKQFWHRHYFFWWPCW